MRTDHETPDGLLYTRTHEWLRRDEENPDEAELEGLLDAAAYRALLQGS